MVDKRLFKLAPGTGRLVFVKTVCLWVSLLADIAFSCALVWGLGNVLLHMGMVPRPLADTWPDALPVIPDNIGLIAAVCVLSVVVKYAATRLAARAGSEASERVKAALREKLYRKMISLGPSYSQRVRTSDIVQSAGEGIEQIQSFFELFLPQLFFSIAAPITLFAFLLPVNGPAATVLLICAPLIVIIVGMVAMRASRLFRKYWGKYTDMGAAFLDNVQGLETLKTFDADDHAAAVMDEKAEEFRVMTMKVLQIQLRSLSAMDLVAYGGAAAGIGVAIWQVSTGALGIAEALLIVLLSASFFLPLRQLGSYFHVAMNGMTSTKRIFALLDIPEPQHGSLRLPALGDGLTVEFDHLGFAYGEHVGDERHDGHDGNVNSPIHKDGAESAISNEHAALHGVSFMAYPGTLTAIVGVSGSGKSTAASLLSGSLVGYSGSLSLTYPIWHESKKLELRDIDEPSLHAAVTLVGAQSHLFQSTVRENLLMADPGASDETMWKALKAARIDDVVQASGQGLDMAIASGGENLSGGQRQRLAIARALLHNSPIMLFDEATSSVDVESEEKILDAIRELARTKTVLMITHRIANAVNADQVVVFEDGKVIETGTHQQLLVADGAYERMYRIQHSVEEVHAERSDMESRIPVTESVEGSRDRHHTADAADNNLAVSDIAGEELSDRPEESGGDTNFKVVSRLLGQVRPLTGYMAAASAAGTLGHLSATMLPVFGIIAVLAYMGYPVWSMNATVAITGMAVCAILRGAMRYLEQYMNHNVAFRLLALFRSKAFAALRRLAPAKLTGKGKGDLIALITTDVELLEIFFAHTISPVVIATVSTAVYAVLLLLLNPWMALALLVTHMLIGVVLPRVFAGWVHDIGAQLRSDASHLDDLMLDDMRGLDEIIHFGQGESRVQPIICGTKGLWKRRIRLSNWIGRASGVSSVLVVASTAASIMIALLSIASGSSEPANIASVVLFASSFGPVLALSALPGSLTQTFAAARRLFALLDEQPAVEEQGMLKPGYDGMSMHNVRFGYGRSEISGHTIAESLVLNGFSLDVPARGILGLKAPSGSGKSTVLRLLMRYWDPQEGVIELSGQPLQEVDARHRRQLQTMMSQETYLFDGTIRDNLLIADAHADDDQVRTALEQASVLDLVDSLPQGLDTQVGELGGRMSEGERQRIGLARMFLRHADLMLFDEPTSRLDALNEAVILASLRHLADEQEVSMVLVSHRDSTMRIADMVRTM
ncbi:ATP-binding cassette domain-containing protein [Bifidobacterium tsurumiense]|uniref:ABC transporter ATP-binding protein/permease n=3 Tax=Bifidobacterium tsurumiense TaxID=356829 RepID=UPI0012B19A20|nr:ATP-binding cassette domain-containing protein [Bifidobacterium tsurumiense]MSS13119.1 ATP-binding cassette domain-containing protein [Bifidobacterium tsurumiense]